ncbi:hypothetical protein A3K73_00665 [Candidatus Pacearchaeota archaeon RBG_13_36_9]|nr:MAG: hypothetical protein A3K73_00665 [Candidatus Pacearchaeota archaeon RBG_13_36_9]
MNEERKTEEFEDDRKKWRIYFDIEKSPVGKGDTNVLVSFVIQEKKRFLAPEDISKLKQDLKDLGKFRIIKQGRKFLEE